MGRDKDFTVGVLDATSLKVGGTSGPDGVAGVAYTHGTMTPGVGFKGTGTLFQTSVVKQGAIIKTTIGIDLTGAASSTTDLDIIGTSGISHIGQVTTAVNGVIYAGQISCGEVPAGGADDIDLYSATEGTGEFDGGIAALTETALVTSGGAHAVGTVKPFTAVPAADQYLYLTGGEAGTAATYTAGRLLIEMWGTVA